MQQVWFVKLEEYVRPFMVFATYSEAEAFVGTYEASLPNGDGHAEIYGGWLVLDE